MNWKHFGTIFAVVLVVGLGGNVASGHEEGEEHMPSGNPEALPALPPSILDEMAKRKEEEPVEEIVRAKRFELVDSNGKVRALFEMTPEDEPRLALADRKGKIQAILGVEPVPRFRDGVPVLRMFDKDGKKRLDIDLTSEGNPEISLHNKNGGHAASLTSIPTVDGGTQWLLSDADGQIRVNLSINHAGANLLFLDKNSKTRARFGLNPDGSPGLFVLDETGKESPIHGFIESTEKRGNENKNEKNVSSILTSD